MSGSVELDRDGANLCIRFPYRPDLVAAVKDIPGRRWDPKDKVWRVPATQVETVYAALTRHLFEFAPEVSSLLAGTLRPAAPRDAGGGRSRARAPIARPGDEANAATDARDAAATDGAGSAPLRAPAWTVRELNERVRDGLKQLFPESLWVVGEVVDFDKSSGRQHRFFKLVEKAAGEGSVVATVEVALFAGVAERLLTALQRHDPPLALRDGLEIRAQAKVDFYPQSGRFQLVVQDIDPSFTLGKLALSREQVLRELADKGLLQRNRMLDAPTPALRIGVLTSPDADGWNDFLRHLQESGCGFEVTLVPVKVQGAELRPTMLAGLRWFAERADEFDVLCIVRGGGSRTDLAWFDDREVAFAVARHPLKVLVGIGHQRDQSVLDVIAHSEKTPTAVAQWLVQGVENARADVRERGQRLLAVVAERVAVGREDLARAGRDLQRFVADRLHRSRADLGASGRQVVAATALRLQRHGSELRAAGVRATTGASRALERGTARLEQQAMRLRLLDPRSVLARGFALVRDAAGAVLPAAMRVRPGQEIQVQFRDGRARARVDAVQEERP
ncbi:MAG: exodeoxyribonuclease VII large subunit [Planctomycetes bacterium]|nr:exodeoxyribonuclease VII large subunit [Planctomycetota bacterium]